VCCHCCRMLLLPLLLLLLLLLLLVTWCDLPTLGKTGWLPASVPNTQVPQC
jgi:hypothetical protein